MIKFSKGNDAALEIDRQLPKASLIFSLLKSLRTDAASNINVFFMR